MGSLEKREVLAHTGESPKVWQKARRITEPDRHIISCLGRRAKGPGIQIGRSAVRINCIRFITQYLLISGKRGVAAETRVEQGLAVVRRVGEADRQRSAGPVAVNRA